MKNILLQVESNIERVIDRISNQGSYEDEIIEEELNRDFTEEELGDYKYRSFRFRYKQFTVDYTVNNECDADCEKEYQINKVSFIAYIK